MIAAPSVALAADGLLILALPRDATHLAIAQSAALAIGLAALLVFAKLSGARWPRAGDIAWSCAGVATMVFALLPLRASEPGVVTLLAETLAGLAIYGVFVALFDIAGLRRVLLDAVRAARARA